MEDLLSRVGRYDTVDEMLINGRGVVDALVPYLEPGWRILDYGAGLGRLSIPLTERRYDVTAWDPSLRMSAFLRTRRVKVVEEIPDADRFDLVLCCFVLQHLTWWQALRAMQAISEVGKRCLFTVPTVQQWDGDHPPNYVPPESKQWLPIAERSRESWIVDESRVAELTVNFLTVEPVDFWPPGAYLAEGPNE